MQHASNCYVKGDHCADCTLLSILYCCVQIITAGAPREWCARVLIIALFFLFFSPQDVVLDHAGLDFSPPAFQSRISEAYIFDADRPDAHVCATWSIGKRFTHSKNAFMQPGCVSFAVHKDPITPK
jgi:hypothetical protein